jgi:hypothetical protein
MLCVMCSKTVRCYPSLTIPDNPSYPLIPPFCSGCLSRLLSRLRAQCGGTIPPTLRITQSDRYIIAAQVQHLYVCLSGCMCVWCYDVCRGLLRLSSSTPYRRADKVRYPENIISKTYFVHDIPAVSPTLSPQCLPTHLALPG